MPLMRAVAPDTASDYQLKTGLLHDMLTIVDVEAKLTGKETQVGGFDLIWNNGPVHVKKPSSCSTYLGCYNNRVQQLKQLHKKLGERRR